MYHFFIQSYQVKGGTIKIEGADVNHIKNVLRMKVSEQLTVTDEDSVEYHCEIESLEEEAVWLRVLDQSDVSHELPSELFLFQSLPKGDKMELIIQKAVELGVCAIIPMETKRCVVKLDEKKRQSKQKRWSAIAEAAAKQSKRSKIPKIHEVVTFSEALKLSEDLQVVCIPYEQEKGMQSFLELMEKVKPDSRIGFFIGPEGGFEEAEVQSAIACGVTPVSLGGRVLRTETASLALLSAMMLKLECASCEGLQKMERK